MGFVPVFREIGEHTYHVKLYLDDLKIKDREELYMFTATYFREGSMFYLPMSNAPNYWFMRKLS